MITIQPTIPREIRTLLARIAAIQANAGRQVSEVMLERIIGAEHGLLAATGRGNYLTVWLDATENAIRKVHATKLKQPCTCGVCRRAA